MAIRAFLVALLVSPIVCEAIPLLNNTIRITGGVHAQLDDFPYVVSIQKFSSPPTPLAKVSVKRDATHEAVHVLFKRVKRVKQPGMGVWMLHPWSPYWICYSCYLTRKWIIPIGMECRSGIDYPIDCGPMPSSFQGHTTSHISTTSTKTIARTSYSTSIATATAYIVNTTDSSGSDNELIHFSKKKRSWHTPVKFLHPFQLHREVCADAEWQRRGKHNTYIVLQNIHFCGLKDNPKSNWIGPPPTVVHSFTVTKTSSDIIGRTATSTLTTTLVTTSSERMATLVTLGSDFHTHSVL